MTQKVLFKTVHGSRLYGLAHQDSDWDFYTVLDRVPKNKARYAKQKISADGTDAMTVDFGTWLQMCVSGVPQALEAMFSSSPIMDDISHFRRGYRVSTGASERYLRTITSFTLTQDNKRKRHGLRLALNMHDFTRQGFFNPTLSANEVDFATEYAKKDCDVVYAMAMNIALDRLPPRMIR
jgi:predicted nucleotidyltransferase